MYWENSKIIRKMIDYDLVSSKDSLDEEYEIISAEAKHYDGSSKVIGNLTITNKRVVFSSKYREDVSFTLEEIEIVKSVKHLFAVADKLTIVANNKENVFLISYSSDWVSIIEQLLKESLNKNR